MSTIKIALSQKIHNKVDTSNRGELALFNSFENAEITPDELVTHLTSGKAIAVGTYTDDRRKVQNFIQSSVWGLDFDDNISVADIAAKSDLSDLCYVAYPTARSTPELRKSRAIIISDTPCENADEWKGIAKGLITRFAGLNPDVSCKDAARIFYGSDNTSDVVKVFSNTVDLDKLKTFIIPDKPATEPQPIVKRETMPKVSENKARQAEIKYVTKSHNCNVAAIQNAARGTRQTTIYKKAIRSFGIALASDVISAAQVESDCIRAGLASGHPEYRVINAVSDAMKRATCATLPDFTVYRKSENGSVKRNFGAIDNTFNVTPFKTDKTVDVRYITQAELPAGDIVIKSAMNTGKTELLRTEIAALQAKLGYAPSVLILTHLQSLADNLAKRLGIENYQWLPDGMVGQAGQIVCSYNSIKKLNPNNKFDFIAIDETTLFIEHGFGETMKNEIAFAYPILKLLLANAGRVVLLDAHMSDTMSEWLRGIRPHLSTLQNTYKHAWGNLLVYSRPDSIIAKAQAAIEDNKGTVVITSNSRQLTSKLHKLFTDKYGECGIVVNGETSKYINSQALFSNLDNELPKKRWLICSPSVSTGVNITTPVYAVFGVFTHQFSGISVAGMVQMLGRFRNAQHRAVYVQDNQTDNPLPEKWETIYRENIERIIRNAEVNNFANEGLNDLSSNNIELLQLEAKMQAAKNMTSNKQFAAFCSLARGEGYLLEFLDLPCNEQIREQLKDVAELLYNETRELVCSLPPVDRDTWQRFNRNGSMTREINAGHERWKIETCTGQNITPEIYDIFYKPELRKALYRFNSIFEAFNVVSKRDREQSKNQVFSLYRRNETIIRELVITGMKAAFGDDMLKSTAVLTAEEITSRMADWLATHMTDIKLFVDRRFDLSKKAISILRRLLSKVGVKLGYKQIRLEGKRIMQYWIDRKHLALWYQFSVTSRAFAQTGKLSKITNIHTDIDIRDFRRNQQSTGTNPEKLPILNIQAGKIIPPGEYGEIYATGD